MGERITILYRLEDDPDYPFSEVVGVLEAVEAAGMLAVRKRSGDLVQVPVSDIVRFRFIPQKLSP